MLRISAVNRLVKKFLPGASFRRLIRGVEKSSLRSMRDTILSAE
jgi:hypothetical protein